VELRAHIQLICAFLQKLKLARCFTIRDSCSPAKSSAAES
jgi:hypothetical protein